MCAMYITHSEYLERRHNKVGLTHRALAIGHIKNSSLRSLKVSMRHFGMIYKKTETEENLKDALIDYLGSPFITTAYFKDYCEHKKLKLS